MHADQVGLKKKVTAKKIRGRRDREGDRRTGRIRGKGP